MPKHQVTCSVIAEYRVPSNSNYYFHKSLINLNRMHIFSGYNYEHHPKACVNGANIVLYPKMTLEQCKIRCDERIDCEAFEYGVGYGGKGRYKPEDCNLQSSADLSGCDGVHHNLDLYVKKGMCRNFLVV